MINILNKLPFKEGENIFIDIFMNGFMYIVRSVWMVIIIIGLIVAVMILSTVGVAVYNFVISLISLDG